MVIHGKEIGFALTVGASVNIAKLCPNNDISRIDEVIGSDYVSVVETTSKLMRWLNDGYVGLEKLAGREAARITDEEIMLLTPKELTDVTQHLFGVLRSDSKPEIEVESKNAEEGAQAS